MKKPGSTYLEWAKLHKPSRFNLATSAVMSCSIADFDVRIEDMDIRGDGSYGYDPLQHALADKCGVSPDCVVSAAGTSMANYLAMAGLVEPGDEVLVEHPAYEPLLAVATHLGAEVKRFKRTLQEGFRVVPEEIERSVTNRTKCVEK